MEICLNAQNTQNHQFLLDLDPDDRSNGLLHSPSQKGGIYEGLDDKHPFFDFHNNSIHLPQEFSHEKDRVLEDKESLDSASKKLTCSTENAESHSKSPGTAYTGQESFALTSNPIFESNESCKVGGPVQTKRTRVQREKAPRVLLACEKPGSKAQTSRRELLSKKESSDSGTKGKETKQALEPGILDLDREIALLKRAGKKVKEYFELKISGGTPNQPETAKRRPFRAERKPKTAVTEPKTELPVEKEDKEPEKVDPRPIRSKKISKTQAAQTCKMVSMKKQARKKFRMNHEKEEAIHSLPKGHKKEIDQRIMVQESTSEGSAASHIEEETDTHPKADFSAEIKNFPEISDLSKLFFGKDQNSGSGESAPQDKIQVESAPIVLKAKEDVHERIGDYYQAQITPFSLMKYFSKRNFKQVWRPGSVSDEMIEECDQIAETILGIKYINQGKLIKMMAGCQYSKDDFRELLEEKKNWSRNQLKLKKIYNENK